MTTERNLDESRAGVRSYRGRTLEEILPQIRAELGADAVILREREGLVGGVGGFFAQRFIEVDARRGDGQSIDVYDDAPEDDLRGFPGEAAATDPVAQGPQALRAPEADEIRVTKHETPAGATESRAFRAEPESPPAKPSEPKPFVPPSLQSAREAPPIPAPEPTPEPPASTRRFETGIFMERLREASAALPEDAVELGTDPSALRPTSVPPASVPPAVVVPEPVPAAPPAESQEAQPPTPTFDQSEVDSALAALAKPARKPRPPRQPRQRPKPGEGRATRPPRPQKQTPASRRAARLLAAGQPDPAAAPPTAAEVPPAIPAQAAPGAAEPTTFQPAPQNTPAVAPPPPGFQNPAPPQAPPPQSPAQAPLPQSPRQAPAPAPQSPPPAQSRARSAPPTAELNPYEAVRERPAAPPYAAAGAPAPASRPIRPAIRPRPVHTPAGIGPRKYTAPPPRVTIEPRRSGNGLRETISRLLGRRKTIVLRPPAPQPLDRAAAAEVAKTLSTRGASESWTSELIDAAGAHGNPLTGDLRASAEAELARRILPAPPLPATGAAIAFIGAGGSGKTRCTAAMASAYRRGSTLHVTVVALDNPEGARELSKLLADDGVPVVSLNSEQAKLAIDAGRPGGLVIVDTAATTPTDPTAVEALGAKLEPLGLDAVYVTLPATLGPSAARRVLASFATLDPAAVTITHADETDQLAVVVEIAINHRIPLAYFHSGTDHTNALSAIDPPAIAQELLP